MTPPPPPRDLHADGPGGAKTVSARLREAADLLETDPADVPDATKRGRLLVLCAATGQLDAALAREVSVFPT